MLDFQKWFVLLVLLFLCFAGCAGIEPYVFDPVKSRTRLEAELMEFVDSNRHRRCFRPILHGLPVPGPADEDMLAILRPTGDLEKCFQFLGNDESINDWLADPKPATPSGFQQIADRCNDLSVLLSRAVRHIDSCSPFLAGRRATSEGDPINILRAAKAVSIIAIRHYLSNEVHNALEIIFDFIRFAQDYSRGVGSNVFLAMSSGAAVQMVLDSAFFPWIDRIDIEPDTLDVMSHRLDILIDTQAPLRQLFLGQIAEDALQSYLPCLNEPGWIPPGGINRFMNPGDWPPRWCSTDTESDLIARWQASVLAYRTFRNACTNKMSTVDCCFRILESSDLDSCGCIYTYSQSKEESENPEVAFSGFQDFVAMQQANNFFYLNDYILVGFRLAVARLYLQIRRRLLSSDSAPPIPSLNDPVWKKWIIDPSSESPMRIQRISADACEVRPAKDLETQRPCLATWTPPVYRLKYGYSNAGL